ncbi:MAG: sulfurtransferase [Phycisphaerae bacterium]|nr:sulfurtransferase [Phycisphaerae bacterium]
MSPRQAAEALRDEDFVLIDVRETDELAVAAIPGAVHIPLGQLKTRVHEIDADEDTPIGVLCHHGRRSFQATVYLQQEGLSGARSVAGGIELWSQTVDPSIPRY